MDNITGLRYEQSSPSLTLGLWVRIPLELWMSVCIYSVCVYVAALHGLIPRPRSPAERV
jgi:hypothetical protein